MRLLDLFCCEGGAATGYQRAGFDVTGVDIDPQPRYPFAFIQADALEYLHSLSWVELMHYDVIHASPPCQRWASGTPNPAAHPDLIEPTRAALIATGLPYIIENVRGAPLRDRVMICGGGLGLTVGRWQLHRHRYFESNIPLLGVPCATHRAETISVVGNGTPSGMRKPGRQDPRMADRRAVMEMPWASRYGTSQAGGKSWKRSPVRSIVAALRSLTPEPAPTPTRSLPRERVCTSCGVVSLVQLGRGCPACGASSFALRPVAGPFGRAGAQPGASGMTEPEQDTAPRDEHGNEAWGVCMNCGAAMVENPLHPWCADCDREEHTSSST